MRHRACCCSTTTSALDPFAVWAATACLLAVVVRLGGTFRDNGRMLRASRHEAATDALTGLGNRRALIAELERRLAEDEIKPAVLALFDLDGFKAYNDAFGHPAGDLLLKRLGARLAEVGEPGEAFRMGGDEFCVLFPAGGAADLVGRARQALSESGEGFTVTASAGTVALPGEARTVSDALAIADRRMYAHKRGGRMSASNQSKDVLLRAVHERSPNLGVHGGEVAELAERTAERLGLDVDRSARSARAPSCTTSASSPSPTRSSTSPARWTRTSGRSCAATRSSASASWPPRRRWLDVAQARALEPRALRRQRLPRRARRRVDPARLARDRGLRRLGRDDHRPPLPPRDVARRRARRARALRRRAVRPRGGRGVPRRARPAAAPLAGAAPDPEMLARVSATPVPVERDPLEAVRAAFGTGDLRRMPFGWAATT